MRKIECEHLFHHFTSLIVLDARACESVLGQKTGLSGVNNGVCLLGNWIPRVKACAISGQGLQWGWKSQNAGLEASRSRNPGDIESISGEPPSTGHDGSSNYYINDVFVAVCIKLVKLSIFWCRAFQLQQQWNCFPKTGRKKKSRKSRRRREPRWVACESVICRNADTIGRVLRVPCVEKLKWARESFFLRFKLAVWLARVDSFYLLFDFVS